MTADVIWCGPPDAQVVLLVHGLGGSHRTWDPVVPLLSESHRVGAVDLPDGDPVEVEAEALRRLLSESDVSSATIAGHSRGGLVATALAERSPELVQRLVLINTAPSIESRRSAGSRSERLIGLPIVGALVWARLNEQRLRAGLRSAVAPGSEVPAPFVEDLRDTSHSAFAGATKSMNRFLSERPLAERLTSLQIPIDVVFGLRDQRVDPSSLAVYDAVAGVRVTTLEGVGHSPPWEAPEAVSQAIARGEVARRPAGQV